jgi:peptide/nickel transport system ATP-binding protein
MAPPSGCPFHPRCAYATAQCSAEIPAMREIAPEHDASCHRAAELNLRGVDALRG